MISEQSTERELILEVLEGLMLVGNMIVSLGDVVKQQSVGINEMVGAFRDLLVALGDA